MPSLDLRLLGPVEAARDGQRARARRPAAARAARAARCSSPGRAVAADRLADELWQRRAAGRAPSDASLVRVAAPAGARRRTRSSPRGGGYALAVDADVDARRFERLAARGARGARARGRRVSRRSGCTRRSRSGAGRALADVARRRRARSWRRSGSTSCASSASRSGSKPTSRSAATSALVAELRALVDGSRCASGSGGQLVLALYRVGAAGRGARRVPRRARAARPRARARAGRGAAAARARDPPPGGRRRRTQWRRGTTCRRRRRASSGATPSSPSSQRLLRGHRLVTRHRHRRHRQDAPRARGGAAAGRRLARTASGSSTSPRSPTRSSCRAPSRPRCRSETRGGETLARTARRATSSFSAPARQLRAPRRRLRGAGGGAPARLPERARSSRRAAFRSASQRERGLRARPARRAPRPRSSSSSARAPVPAARRRRGRRATTVDGDLPRARRPAARDRARRRAREGALARPRSRRASTTASASSVPGGASPTRGTGRSQTTMDWSYELLGAGRAAAAAPPCRLRRRRRRSTRSPPSASTGRRPPSSSRRLVDASLVRAEPAETTRYRLLETVRQYAAAKLAEDPDADEVRRRARRALPRASRSPRTSRSSRSDAGRSAPRSCCASSTTSAPRSTGRRRTTSSSRCGSLLALENFWVMHALAEGQRAGTSSCSPARDDVDLGSCARAHARLRRRASTCCNEFAAARGQYERSRELFARGGRRARRRVRATSGSAIVAMAPIATTTYVARQPVEGRALRPSGSTATGSASCRRSATSACSSCDAANGERGRRDGRGEHSRLAREAGWVWWQARTLARARGDGASRRGGLDEAERRGREFLPVCRRDRPTGRTILFGLAQSSHARRPRAGDDDRALALVGVGRGGRGRAGPLREVRPRRVRGLACRTGRCRAPLPLDEAVALALSD